MFALCLMIAFVSGCAGLPVEREEIIVRKLPFRVSKRQGVYHKVQKGETLWRIAKTYSVALDDIIRANKIPNVAQVEKSQLVFIPGAKDLKHVLLDNGGVENDFIWPVKGKIISYFQQRQGLYINKGINIEVSKGEVVRAARTGRVIFSDYLAGYGQTIVLDHEDGLYSVYAQNAQLLVSLGDFVLKNNEIAHVGNYEKLAFLHFEIRKKSKADNPLNYLP
ncbi:hypothetical protein MNBD_BACTEROID05-969 [hydrothermal vent metagenome]|uniref:LysM domain-containing protein n=1 Tax=hydrothermal vent metagenome TaxID=652676 RepID=A0A3B0TL92_9ZZZZ